MKGEVSPSGPVEVWYDGCCEPVNPGGHAACGVLIRCNGKTLLQESRYIGHGPRMSNNVAEYSGILAALEYLLQAGLTRHRVTLRGDSMLSVRQMSGEWRVRGGLYLPYWQRARELAGQFPDISFVWIPREENSEADALSKAGLKEKGIQFHIQKV